MTSSVKTACCALQNEEDRLGRDVVEQEDVVEYGVESDPGEVLADEVAADAGGALAHCP